MRANFSCFSFFILTILAFSQCITIQINTNISVFTLPDTYLSVSIDSSQLVGSHFWSTNPQPFNFSRPRLINMAKALAPAVLRVGGTDGDKVISHSLSHKRLHVYLM